MRSVFEFKHEAKITGAVVRGLPRGIRREFDVFLCLGVYNIYNNFWWKSHKNYYILNACFLVFFAGSKNSGI